MKLHRTCNFLHTAPRFQSEEMSGVFLPASKRIKFTSIPHSGSFSRFFICSYPNIVGFLIYIWEEQAYILRLQFSVFSFVSSYSLLVLPALDKSPSCICQGIWIFYTNQNSIVADDPHMLWSFMLLPHVCWVFGKTLLHCLYRLYCLPLWSSWFPHHRDMATKFPGLLWFATRHYDEQRFKPLNTARRTLGWHNKPTPPHARTNSHCLLTSNILKTCARMLRFASYSRQNTLVGNTPLRTAFRPDWTRMNGRKLYPFRAAEGAAEPQFTA